MEKRKPSISIIVPVYKVEQYLPSCIRSILRQTYRDFELILVDDGSPDSSGAICDEFAEKDSRIRVIHQSNGGVSRARNAGIEAAQGEWVCFVDADDLVTPGYLAAFLPTASCEFEADIVVQGAIGFFGKKIRNKFVFNAYSGTINQCLTEELIGMRTPWGKLFRLDIIRRNKLKFAEGVPYGEDTIFYYQYLLCVNNISLRRDTKYLNRTDNPNSATKRFYSPFVYWKVYEEKTLLLQQLYAKHDLMCPYPDPKDVILLKSWISMAHKNGNRSDYGSLISQVPNSDIFHLLQRKKLTPLNRMFCLFLWLPCYIQRFVWCYKGKI